MKIYIIVYLITLLAIQFAMLKLLKLAGASVPVPCWWGLSLYLTWIQKNRTDQLILHRVSTFSTMRSPIFWVSIGASLWNYWNKLHPKKKKLEKRYWNKIIWEVYDVWCGICWKKVTAGSKYIEFTWTHMKYYSMIHPKL